MSTVADDRHVCHCGKAFIRKEHLRRHQATHSQPSFVCHVCDRSFTRNDVLKRHIAVHNTPQVPDARTRRACDACHESKTKCDGGEQCALCTKRSVSCTYSRDGPATETTSNQKEGEMGEEEAEDVASTNVSEPVPEDQVMRSPTPAETRTPEPRDPLQDDVELARAGLECVANAVAAAMTGKMQKQSPKRTQPWVTKCTRTYFRGFHKKWPIVHAPIFDETTDDTLFVASVLMIGSWLSDDPSVREPIFKLHERFMFYLTRKMAAGEVGPGQPWPYETYQIILLQLVFAFESGVSSLNAHFMLLPLCSSFLHTYVLTSRTSEAKPFPWSPATSQSLSHGSEVKWFIGCRTGRDTRGHSFSWKLSSVATWSSRALEEVTSCIFQSGQSYANFCRLATLLLKVDTYFGLLCNQPPVLQVEELDLGLPPTFALCHGYGIEVFFARDPEEPSWREQLPIAKFLGGSAPLSGLLIEDIMLGFCGTYREIWSYSQEARNPHHSMERSGVPQKLESWKTRLDDISNLWMEPQLKAQEINFLLRAYRGEENASDAGWEISVMTRIAVVCLNTMMLYHILSIHHCADVRTLSILTLESWSLGGGPSVRPLPAKGATLSQWASEPRARSSIIHSISILKAYENSLATMKDVSQTMDPVAHVGLCTGAIVLRGWFASSACNCHAGGMQSLNVDDPSEKDRWIELNGSVSVDSVALCRCSSGPWMARFISALTQGGQLWEMSDSVAECLRKPVKF